MNLIEIWQNYGWQLLRGVDTALIIAFSALTMGLLLGLLCSLVLIYGNRFWALIVKSYVAVLRGTPMLVQIVMLFYILPQLGLTLSALVTAILAIGFNSAAYMSQTFRIGILAVGKGQIEAAKSLGFSPFQIFRLIVLPQALRVILPGLGNEFITLIKDTSLASVIGVAELTYEGNLIMSQTYDALGAFLAIGLVYFCLTSTVGLGLSVLERRLA